MTEQEYQEFLSECQRCRNEGVAWKALVSDVIAANNEHGHTDFIGINISGEEAILNRSKLYYARCQGANFSNVTLYEADIERAWFDRVTGCYAQFTNCSAESASFIGANLEGANLSDALVTECNFTGANLSEADLTKASLTGSNLSGVKGIRSAEEILRAAFQFDSEGMIAYKQFGLQNEPPPYWTVAPGAEIAEVPCTDRSVTCGCGVNVATKKWLEDHGEESLDTWECVIPYTALAGVVVPYAFDGKIRAARIVLRHIVKQGRR